MADCGWRPPVYGDTLCSPSNFSPPECSRFQYSSSHNGDGMPPRWKRQSATFALVTLLLTLSTSWLIAGDKKRKSNAAENQMDEHQRAVHALNRLTFGPRPGDVDRVAAMGVDKWIDQQLNPNK